MIANDITVIVPTYNHEALICLAIESIVRQSVFHQCRVLISDDCSTDRTFSLAKSFEKYHSNIIVRRNDTNLGTMNHYRTLVSEITTAFTAILEGDDMWISESKLETQRKFLEYHPKLGMCFTACVVDYEVSGTQVEHPVWNDGRNRIVGLVDLLYDNPVATFSNCFYRSSALKEALANPDSVNGYDWLCTLKIASSSGVGFMGQPSTLYRLHRNGIWSSMSAAQRRCAIRKSLRSFLQQAPSDVTAFVLDAIENVP